MTAVPIPVIRITPQRRREMQHAYEASGRLLAANRNAEALDLARQCVLADPDSGLYVQRFLLALRLVVPGTPPPGAWRRMSNSLALAAPRRAAKQSNWEAAFTESLARLLEPNLAEISARAELLLLLAAACEHSHCTDAELAWLQGARDLVSRALQEKGNRGNALQATAAEIERRLGLALMRNGNLLAADELPQSPSSTSAEQRNSPEADAATLQLKQAIDAHPADVAGYVRLAERYQALRDWQSAEAILVQARFVEPSPALIRKLEDARMGAARHRVELAQARAKTDASLASGVARLESERLRIECEIYRARCDRDGSDFESWLNMASRLADLGNVAEALAILRGTEWPPEWAAAAAQLLEHWQSGRRESR